jgi:hypothetical protein
MMLMEKKIWELIIDKKESRMKKGYGLNMDIVIVWIENVGCGVMGENWKCDENVRYIENV